MEFLVLGATQFGEPGVFMMIEENAAELTANVRSLGFDLEKLSTHKKIVLDHVHIDESGAYLPLAFANHGAIGLIPGHAAPSNVIFNPPSEL